MKRWSRVTGTSGCAGFSAVRVSATWDSRVLFYWLDWTFGFRYSWPSEANKRRKPMASLARADLETLLHTKNLDRTLTRGERIRSDLDYASTGHAGLDARLSGGIPRGQVSELVGPRSSGRTGLMLQMLAAATRRGELVALVDALDMFDVESAVGAGIELERLLWIRGLVVTNPGMCRDLNQRAVV